MRPDMDNLAARRRGEAAYTVTEMLVVSGIVLLVAGLSVPMLTPFFAGGSARDAADVFKLACVTARSRAIQEGISFEVVVIATTTEQSAQVKAVDAALTGLTGEARNRLIERKVLLPEKTRFEGISGTVRYVFNPSGGIDRDQTTGVLSGFCVVDAKREHGKDLEVFASTGTVTSEEKSF